MVNKKQRWGFATGNTLRRRSVQDTAPHGGFKLEHRHFETALSNIKDAISNIKFGDDYDHIHYPTALQSTLNAFSYLPDPKSNRDDVEYSTNKQKCWEILEELEESCLPYLWRVKPEKDSPNVLPFQLDYTQSNGISDLKQSFSYHGKSPEINRDPFGKPLPYDRRWKHQKIYHNKRHRGVQREAQLLREKRTKSRGKVEDGYKENEIVTAVDWDPPGLDLKVSRNDVNRKKLLCQPPLKEQIFFVGRSRECWKHSSHSSTTERGLDSYAGAVHGPRYGAKSSDRGVFLITQERFSDIQHLLKHRGPPFRYINHPANPSSEQQRSIIPHRDRARILRERRVLVKKQRQLNERRMQEEAQKQRDEQVSPSVKALRERRKIEKRERRLRHRLQKETETPLVVEEPAVPLEVLDKRARKKEEKMKRKELKKSMRKSYQVGRNCAQGSSMDRGKPSFLKPEGLKTVGHDHDDANRDSHGFFITESSFVDDQVNQIGTVNAKKEITPKINTRAVEDRDNPKEQSISHKRVDMPLWQALEVILSPDNHPNIEIELQKCTDRTCSVVKTAPTTGLNLISEPACGKQSNIPAAGKNIELMKDTNISEFAENENDVQKDSPKKKKRKRKKSTKLPLNQCLKYLESSQESFFTNGFPVRIKSSTFQKGFLDNKYPNRVQEGSSRPRRLSVDVSELAGVLKESVTSQGGELPFLNLHAVLLVEAVNVQLAVPLEDPGELDKNLPQQTVLVHFKCDFEASGKKELYRRLKYKIRPHLVYSLPRLIEYFVEVYKVMVIEGYRQQELRLSETGGQCVRTRQYEWLYSQCPWEYTISSALDAYQNFKNKQHLFNTPPSSRPGSGRLQKESFSPQNGFIKEAVYSGALSVQSNSLCREDRIQYRLCQLCEKLIILSGNLQVAFKDTATLDQLHSISTQGWTLKYSRADCGHVVCDSCNHSYLVHSVQGKTPIQCPVAECTAVVDPVVVLSAVSLHRYREYLRGLVDQAVASHPQWGWCPGAQCDRAAKISGSAMMETRVVVECHCGHAWCFTCNKDAHWPASCDQAIWYRQLRDSEILDDQSPVMFVMGKLKCKLCQNRQKCPPTRGSKPKDNTNPKQPPESEVCDCMLQFCHGCLSAESGSTSLQVPKAVLENKSLSLMTSQDALLPLLLYHQAINHHVAQYKWRPSLAEPKAALLARQILKSKSKTSKAGTSKLGPAIGQSMSNAHLAPSVGTEKLFLILVYQFVYQSHCLLEYIYVLFSAESAVAKETKVSLLQEAFKLEQSIQEIDQVMHSLRYTPSSIMGRLKRLFESGKLLMTSLTTRALHLSTSASRASTSHLPKSRSQLTPISLKPSK